VIRPKSKATVVERFPATPVRSSTSSPAFVMVSSVLSGRISLTEPTRVVLPTPKPPTTTIFSPSEAVLRSGAADRVRSSAVSEPLESTEHLLQRVEVGQPGLARREPGVPGGDPAGLQQVAQQDLHHADR
jgi:hypothetical protein